MIRCPKAKCRLHNEKNACRHKDQWGICGLTKAEFDKYIVRPATPEKEAMPKRETKTTKEERKNG